VALPALVLAALVSLVAGCGPPMPAPPAASDQPPLLDPDQYRMAQAQARAALGQTYGPALQLRTDAQLGTVAFLLAPAVALPDAPSPASALTRWVLTYRSLFGVLDTTDLKSVGSDVDGRGMTHVRLVQQQDGVPVWGTVLVGHLDAQGMLVGLHGRLLALHLQPSVPSDPTLLPEAARQQALAALRKELPSFSPTAYAPTLYYLSGDHQLILVYRFEVAGQLDDLPVRLALFVNANTGELVRREDLVARIDVTVPAHGHGKGVLGDAYELAISQRGSTYSLEDPTRGKLRTTAVHSGERLPGKTVTSKDPDTWTDAGQAVDVHAHLQALWDYFATTHKRFGWDGEGSGIVAVTHLSAQAPLALFDGERLLFGDGDGKDLLPTGAALDVVAHEYAHALSRSTAELAGEGESGALDEGLADLWGCLIEQAVDPTHGNWLIGERVLVANRGKGGGADSTPAALRDLVDPLRTGQARSLAEYQADADGNAPAPADQRSLLLRDARHKNAGIAGHAGYLLAQRLGSAQAAAIVYRALTTYLHRYSGFADAVDAMAAAARDLYGDGMPRAAVLASWGEVGVSGISP
jgi:Zn-dependent metalloprotease